RLEELAGNPEATEISALQPPPDILDRQRVVMLEVLFAAAPADVCIEPDRDDVRALPNELLDVPHFDFGGATAEALTHLRQHRGLYACAGHRSQSRIRAINRDQYSSAICRIESPESVNRGAVGDGADRQAARSPLVGGIVLDALTENSRRLDLLD